MKNTMKKLLCMALVIMLLVSAVPAFAMADDGFGDDMTPSGGDGFETPVGGAVVYSDGSGTLSAGGEESSDRSDPGESADSAAPGVKIEAYLYTTNQDGTQFKLVKHITPRNVSSALTVKKLLTSSEFLNQGSYDSNGISEYQKYDYTFASDVTKPDNESASSEVGDDPVEPDSVYVFVRKRKAVQITLQLSEPTVRGSKEITAYAYDVLNLPDTFAKNDLKANNGYYIYKFTKNDEDTPLGNTFRVPGSAGEDGLTITGHQDLTANKAENDKIYAGTAGDTINNGTTTGGSSGNSSANGSTGSNKFPYPVYLNIYKDTLVGSPDKRVEITKGAALDGTVTLSEVKNVVKNYYTAKDSDGISYDGLYIAEGNWVADYVDDTAKHDSIDVGTMRQTGTVYINVMIGNAKAKSSSTADASNPKTGDAIFVPMMVMGLTGTALAAAYVFGKKRIAR